MKVRFVGTAPMSYQGVKYYLGQELDVSPEFYALHNSRLQQVDDAIEATFEVRNVEPIESMEERHYEGIEEEEKPKRRRRRSK